MNTQIKATKYCLYARKSTEQEDRQALSIESQIKEMLHLASKEELNVIEIKRESHSSKEAGARPVYNQLIEEIKQQKFDGILTWAPDRLSRNAGDLGAVVDLMDQGLLHEIRTYGQCFGNNPNEKFLLMILGSQAKLENDNKVVNVKRGLRARVEMGLWPAVAPTGYRNHPDRSQKCVVIVDEQRAPTIIQMFEYVAHYGWSGRKLFYWLRDDIRFTSRSNKPLTLSNVYLILKNSFYYGRFEYPKGSGNWYDGKHKPLISKALFDAVQHQLSGEHSKTKRQSKEFAFTKLIHCGLCNSTISADEKIKHLKNGEIKRYVYYGCSKFYNKKCSAGYIREEQLITQLAHIIDTVSLDDIGMKSSIEKNLATHYAFQQSVLGAPVTKIKLTDIDIRNYAKYILKHKTVHEKRVLLQNLKSKLVLQNKKVFVRN